MRYNAFISYKHSEIDMYVAKQIHKRLETFKIPNSIKKKFGKKKIERVFRDVEELPIGSDLGDNITAALRESEFLIVICSKESKKSYWVNKEIETFIELNGNKNILAVLVDGEPDETFPDMLLRDGNGNPIEPLAADVRGINKKQIKKKIKSEIVRLAAQIIGCSYDELKQRHKERRMRKIITATAVITALAVSFGIYSVYNYFTIKKNYEAKLINQSKYLADISTILLEEGNRVNAGLVALEALPNDKNNRPLVSVAQLALSQALYAYADGNTFLKDRILKHDLYVEKIRYSTDGSKLITIDFGDNVYLWDVNNGNLIIKISPRIDEKGYYESVYDAIVTDDDKIVIIDSNGIRCCDFNGEIIWCEDGTEDYISCLIDENFNLVAVVGTDIVEVWNVDSQEMIASMKNTDDNYVFTSSGTFDMNGENLAVACFADSDNVERGKIYIMSMKDSMTRTISTKKDYIVEMNFSSDGDITVVSRDGYGTTIDVENFNAKNGELIWEDEFEKSAEEIIVSDTKVKTRNYTDNEEHNEVIISMNNSIHVYDETDGKLINFINVPQGIADVLISSSSSIGYVIDDKGVLNFYDLNSGDIYSDSAVEINKNICQAIVKNGVLAARIYYSSDVLIMKYIEGYGIEIIDENLETITEMEYSENEEVYVVINSGYNFYSTESNELISQYELDDNYAMDSCFVNNDTYAVFYSNGDVDYIDVTNGDIETIQIDPDEEDFFWNLSENKNYAVAYSYKNYYLFNVANREIESEGELDDYINKAIVTNEGDRIYFINYAQKVVAVSTKENKEKKFEFTEFNDIAMSNDGKYLAGSCKDNNMRIYSTESGEVLAEFYFSGKYNSFIQFIPGENKIVVQGDSFYIGIYDMDSKEYIYISDEQYDYVEKIVTDVNSIAVITSNDMVIINKKDYEPIAIVNNGISYMPECGYVYTYSLGRLCQFPYMDFEMLMEQAKNEFGNYSLTKLERIQYNID